MPQVPFDQLPQESRLWIFPAARALSADEASRVLNEIDTFLEGWAAHGTRLPAGRELRDQQFVLVAVDEQAAGVSGCSIDALVRRMQTLGGALGVELVDHSPVLFRRDAEVVRVSRDEFADLASRGSVTLDTPVFDNTLTRLGDLRTGRWEVPARDAWHARAFF